MLKGAGVADLRYDTLALAGLMLIAMVIAITRFRRTLD
jgi:ABC-2 type transport system permease protein